MDEAYHDQPTDRRLAGLLPPDLRLVKVGALPARVTRPFGIGDISIRAFYSLREAIFRLLSTESIDVVFITGSPYYPMLLAPSIKRRFGVPVVLDFQDPWVSDWGADQPVMSKAGIVHVLANRLEPRAVAAASFVTSVSDLQNEAMAERYPWLDGARMAGIPIGGDPDDFVALKDETRATRALLDDGYLHFSYVGTFLPRAGALVQVLFRSFARLRETTPHLAERIRFNFIGTSNQFSCDSKVASVSAIAEREGVAAAVREIPQRVPYLSALGVLVRSTCLLLIGSDEPHYTASKIYPALMSGRPFLSLFHAASSAHNILVAAGGGKAHAFSDLESLVSLESAISESMRQLALQPHSVGTPESSAYHDYHAHNIAARFARIFDSIEAG